MRVIFKIVFGNLKKESLRSALAFVGVFLAVTLIALCCSLSFALRNAVYTIGDRNDIENIKLLTNGLIVLASVMGCLMIYATFSIHFDRKAETVATLMLFGMSRSQRYVMMLTEALVYGIFASLFGTILGTAVGRVFYNNGFYALAEALTDEAKSFTVDIRGIVLAFALGIITTIAAAFIPMLKLIRKSVMDTVRGKKKINISLKQGLVSTLMEKCFGRLGKLAGQNYDNHKGKYRAISFALSGGTIFVIAIYSFFMYPYLIHSSKGWELDGTYYILLEIALILAVLFVLIFLICASGSAVTNMDRRQKELSILKSMGMSNGKLCAMMCIESLYLMFYSTLYGLVGSLIVDYFLMHFWRIAEDEPLLHFSFPTGAFLLCVLYNVVVSLLFAFYCVLRIRRMDLIRAMKSEER